MEKDALTAGVGPGGLNNYRQIKVLCCYIINSIGSPISASQLPEILQYEEIANFFEVTRAVEELKNMGNIVETDGYLYLTENGRKISEEMAFSLPYTVKEKSVKAAMKLLTSIKIHEENKVDIEENNGIYTVTCTMFDKEEVIMSLTFNVKSKMLAESIKENFYNDPFKIYSGNIQMLTESN